MVRCYLSPNRGALLATAGSQELGKRRGGEWRIARPWGTIGMGNVSEVLVLRIVNKAGLEPPFGPRAKMAMPGRLVCFDGKPTHPQSWSVYRGALTRSICGSRGTW